jgi:hypothetical protein
VSLIDDALKRAQAAGEGEAARPAGRPWIPTPLPDPGIARRRALLQRMGIAAALAVAVVAAVWLYRREFRSPLPMPAGEGRGEGRPAVVAVPQSTPTPDAVALATPIVVAKPRTTRPERTADAGPVEGEPVSASPTPVPRAPQAIANGKTYAGAVNLPGGAKIELGGIVWSETEPRALLNDRIAAVGAFVEGFSLTKIEENRVVLEKDGVTIYISVR